MHLKPFLLVKYYTVHVLDSHDYEDFFLLLLGFYFFFFSEWFVCFFSELEEHVDSDGQHSYFMPSPGMSPEAWRDWLNPPDMVDEDWFTLGQAELENALKVGIKVYNGQGALCVTGNHNINPSWKIQSLFSFYLQHT